MKMMLVTRSVKIRQMIRTSLTREGIYAVIVECENTTAMLDLYRGHRPEWVLMDLDLSGSGGLEASRQLRAAYPEAQILFLTDYDDVEYRASMRASGGRAHVLKEHIHCIPDIIARQEQKNLQGLSGFFSMEPKL